MREFTFKALALGIVFGIVFGAANAYLGLRAGLTVSTSIPVAVMTVAVFRLLGGIGRSGTILEANISQTTGSASSSLASGVIFTLPALFMWGMAPDLLQMVLLALCGGLLGVLFMIPLRDLLIVREHRELPYPEGTACAEVLKASEDRGEQASHVFFGLGIGAAFKALTSWARLIPDHLSLKLPLLSKAELSIDLSAALFGVGYILGPRVATIMVSGGLLSSIVIIPVLATWGEARVDPLFPETMKTIAQMSAGELWNRYVRYIGAGAVAAAGILTLIRAIPMMLQSFRAGARAFRGVAAGSGDVSRTDRDLPLWVLGAGALAIALVMALVPQVFSVIEGIPRQLVAALCVVVFAFFFVTVAARIVGLVGVTSNPTSGMTIAALLGTATVFLAIGWTDATGKAAALMVGCVVAIAASISGDTSQDLKTGFLLGATPRNQQLAQLAGVLTSATFVCLSVLLLAETFGFGGKELPAPQATLMKLVIDGVIDQSLPWGLVGIGAGIALAAELARIPSLPFAVGVYLPLSTMTPIFVGGLLRWLLTRRQDAAPAEARTGRGVLLGSGFVGGEGLLGVGLAGAAFMLGRKPDGFGHAWAGDTGAWAMGAGAFAILTVWFARKVRRADIIRAM
jgi:putative OPT family oligopeptide transporter